MKPWGQFLLIPYLDPNSRPSHCKLWQESFPFNKSLEIRQNQNRTVLHSD